MPRYLVCVRSFVVLGVTKANGEGLYGTAAASLHERHNERGIDATRKKCAERNVGFHPEPHSILEQGLQSIDGLEFASGEGVRGTLLGGLPRRPIGTDRT